ncbi:hypothetical protein [Halorubellus litoreus]|uniref:DUF8163 domain-containing protein n=1 Tax=Halorubellus litoreus TaxID=755308 RepID=A0ABD5VK57_9EURY
MTSVRERVRVAPTVAVAVACVGLALARPAGIALAVLLALSVALPWPLPFAFGQVAAAVAFDGLAFSTPFVLVQAGLWLALALAVGTSAGTDGRYPRATALAVGVAGTLLVALVAWPAGSPLTQAGVAATVITVVLYVVHRYEQVTVGLVER